MREIPKQYNFEEEDKIYKLWEESGFFNPDNLKGEPFSVMMPPPNVTGVLHLGHAMENTLMDVMARYQRMNGKKVLILPGTDHAAVATQAKVEKVLMEKGIKNPREELGREKLLQEIRKYAENSKSTILSQIKKMGTSCDWSRLAYTFDKKRNVAVNTVFKKMYDDGLVYRGFRVVNWSVKGQSTCSDDELVHIERQAKFYTFKYGHDFPISISTTRPETKLGDTAVAVNPKDKRYKKYIGQIFKVDVGSRNTLEIKIIADEKVDMDFGTGALGVTPAHSMVDFEIYEKQKAKKDPIGFVQVIGTDGKMTQEAGKKYAGLTVDSAREKFVAWLEKENLLEKVEEISQNVGTHERFKDVVEVLPMTQWFVNVNRKISGRNKSLKELMIQAVKAGFGKNKQKVKITPQRFEKVYLSWINNLRDWCISRQIWWGHRIPVYYCKPEMTNNQFPISKQIQNSKFKIQNLDNGCNIYVGIEKPKGEGWIQDPDTLDTWFSSGLWTFSTLGWPQKSEDLKKFHPTSWMQMGYEILFFWMARMILMSAYILDEIPFKDVYIHGILRNEEGKKFSKSSGNSIDPLEVSKKYGTDALRLCLISGTTPGNDLKFYFEKVESFRNFITKLWNMFVYASGSNAKFKLEDKILKSDLKSLSDKWIVGRLEKLTKEISNDFEKFNFSLAQEKLRAFTWNELADWYLEIHKIEKNAKVLGYVLGKLLRLWHPFIPFITERLWGSFSQNKNLLMIQKWPQSDKKFMDKKAEKDFNNLTSFISKIRNIRSGYHIEPARILTAFAKEIKEKGIVEKLARIKLEAKIKNSKKLMKISTPGYSLELDIAGFVDIQKELSLIEKEIKNLVGLISKNEGLLKNENFLGSAPKEIIEANKQRLSEYKEKLKIQKELKDGLGKIK